jgi:sugar/nucleoside kinase (ribokinase family)
LFDIAFVGHFTKDTVVTPEGSTVHLGGAFYYGCHVVTRMGLKAAVVTRLARADWAVVEELEQMGVAVYATETPESTHLRLVYPTANPDERTIETVGFAGPFTPAEVEPVEARTFHVGASIRGEVPLEVIEVLAAKKAWLSIDVQGFVRVNQSGQLTFAEWPEMPQVLRLVNVLKADAAEAEFLTGKRDLREAARALAALGPEEVVLTRNEGVLVLAGNEFTEAPWQAREVKGRTGRGDTCIAAYLGKRLSASPAEAVRFAAALTGRKLEAPGPFKGEIAG